MATIAFQGNLAGIMRKIKIGLALGSGAARGWSHIGVINALKKVGIEIDIVAGCSDWFAGGRCLCMRSIICAGRLGDLFQLLGCFTPDGSLLAARWVTARRACLQSIPRNNAGNRDRKLFPSLCGCCHQFKYGT